MIAYVARHRIACYLLTIGILVLGALATLNINIQFLPNIDLKMIQVDMSWPGAAPKHVETALVVPVEQALSGLNNLSKIDATATFGHAKWQLKFAQDSDMQQAYSEVNQAIKSVQKFPSSSKPPIITLLYPFERIMTLVIAHPNQIRLKENAHQMKQELIKLGIPRVRSYGLPNDRLMIRISPYQLKKYQLTPEMVAKQLRAYLTPQSIGLIGRDSEQTTYMVHKPTDMSLSNIKTLKIITPKNQQPVHLSALATLSFEPPDAAPEFFFQGKPAVRFDLMRDPNSDTFTLAKKVHNWLDHFQTHASVTVMFEHWHYIKDRIALLLKNGMTGFIFIFLILSLTMTPSIAIWVAASIPISIAASLFFMVSSNMSLNMVSLFALIMSLGIIVDDTIVVSEEAWRQAEHGLDPESASIAGATHMLKPVLTASLTTLLAFAPLLTVGGIMGNVLKDIPIVVITVIIASLLECFFILPGHLKHVLKKRPYIPKWLIAHRAITWTRTHYLSSLKNSFSQPNKNMVFLYSTFTYLIFTSYISSCEL